MSADEQELENSDLVPEEEDTGNISDTEADNADASLSAKEVERQKIAAEVEEFLKKGGEIKQVDSHVMSDPPKRPESNYGGQPI